MTISKIFLFVIFGASLAVLLGGCGSLGPESERSGLTQRYGPPRVTGTIKSADITESSGIASSRCQSDVLWTHNDSGDDAFIFAINAKGEALGAWKVADARNIDWEDIAAYKDRAGKCWLYIGEIGNNKLRRPEHTVYRLPEPLVSRGGPRSNKKSPLAATGTESMRFVYPDFDQDAETLMVQPQTGDVYVVTKRVSGSAGVYKLMPEFATDKLQKATFIAELSVPSIPNGFLTGGDISPDGTRVVVCDYRQAYELTLDNAAASFDEIWKGNAEPIELGRREAGEAICYGTDGATLYATSESKNSPIIEVKKLK